MKRSAVLDFIMIAVLTACGPARSAPAGAISPTGAPQPHALTVFAAASLTDAFSEIGQDFQSANPGVTVTFNFAGSQALRTQIQQGAVADVFASANTQQMDTLVADHLIHADAVQIFLTNQLLVILPANNPANIGSLADLTKPGLKLVLAAEEVPAGNYARQALEKLNALYGVDYKGKALANVVSNEIDVRQVVAKVQLGEADAAIVYVSDAVAAPDLKTIAIPADYNVIAQYPIAAPVNAPQPDLAAGFIAYVLSAPGQATLQKWGFTPVSP